MDGEVTLGNVPRRCGEVVGDLRVATEEDEDASPSRWMEGGGLGVGVLLSEAGQGMPPFAADLPPPLIVDSELCPRRLPAQLSTCEAGG